MSFNFEDGDENVHDDFFDEHDDDDDLDLRAFDDTGLLALASRRGGGEGRIGAPPPPPPPPAAAAAIGGASSSRRDEDEDEDGARSGGNGDWDDVDWEDADDDDDNDDDNDDVRRQDDDGVGGYAEGGSRDDDNYCYDDEQEDDSGTTPSFPTRGVVINFGASGGGGGGGGRGGGGRRLGRSNDPDVGEGPVGADDDDNDDNGGGGGATDKSEEPSQPAAATRKRKRNPNRAVLRDAPLETRVLVTNVRRAGMLCDVAMCAMRSNLAGAPVAYRRGYGNDDDHRDDDDDDDCRSSLLSHLAHSLIPLGFHPPRRDDDDDGGDDDAITTTTAQLPFPAEKSPPPYRSGKSIRRPTTTAATAIVAVPTKRTLRLFSSWCFGFLNGAGDRRRAALRRNEAQGASAATATSTRGERRRVRQGRQSEVENTRLVNPSNDEQRVDPPSNDDRYLNGRTVFHATTTADRLIRILTCLSPQYDEDPQLYDGGGEGGGEGGVSDAIDAVEGITGHEKTLLFLVMLRSLGWRARYVESLKPMPLELTVDHPLLLASCASYTPGIVARSRSSSSSSPSASLDVKPPAARKSENDEFEFNERLYDFFRRAAVIVRRDKRRKSRKKCATSTTSSMHTIVDLVSDGGDDDEAPSAGGGEDIERPSKRPSNSLPASFHEGDDVDDCSPLLSWVEVLCHGDDDACEERVTMPWVSINVERECFDRPEVVESVLAWTESRVKTPDNGATPGIGARKDGIGGGRSMSSPKSVRQWHRANSSAKRAPVSYVLAVEHHVPRGPDDRQDTCSRSLRGARFTDVTPRYARAWSRTLRLRGASGKEIVAGRGRCVDEWWELSLKRVNVHCRGRLGFIRGDIATPRVFKGRGDGHNMHTISRPPSPRLSVTKAKTSAGNEVEMIELESSDNDNDRGASQPDCSDSDEDQERMEAKDLAGSMEKEKIPTSKAQFKQSPFYVIPSVLNSRDVLHPDARKNICGVFKGELVYRRSDVSRALRATKWLYRGRKVKVSELGNPATQVKARKKAAVKGFQALSSYGVSEEAQEVIISSMNLKKDGVGEDDGMDNLYGEWQTARWSPPYVGPDDTIPTNDYRNVEKALLNPGLTHMDQTGLAPIARKLGIPYAPCMLGYDGHGGNRTATIRGIVVHDQNVELLREASVEWESHAVEVENQERRFAILRRWKRLVVGMLTKERLDREYG